MRQRQILLTAIAVAAVIAAASMVMNHRTTTDVRPMRADAAAPALGDEAITHAINDANVRIQNLSVRNVGGIVILRGAAESEAAERAVSAVKNLGFARVANLIRPNTWDDESIRREAERQLARARALDGCTLKVSVTKGVVSVSGTSQSELQADAARQVLKAVEGVREVRVDLTTKI